MSSMPPSPAPQASVVDRLRAAGCVFAEDEAALLEAEARSPEHLEELVEARTSGLPLEQVLGWAEFCGLRVRVSPGVFVPRRRTELLARHALRLLPAGAPAVVVDLCCGSGAVAAAVLAARPDDDVHAADIDEAAVACARLNLPKGHVHHGDLYAALPARLRGRVDVVVANAPYVPTREIALMPRDARLHEPVVALDGGVDGLAVHHRVAIGAGDWLAPTGVLLVETSGSLVDGTVATVRAAGYEATVVRDDEVDGTVVVGRRA